MFTISIDKGFFIEDQKRLNDFYGQLKKEANLFLGYPSNTYFDYSPLFRFLEFPMNNVGDPFTPSNYQLNSNDFECEVIREFSRLCYAPEGASWGYVTNGGTEGNMYGLFLARELYPEGMVYYSQDTHYSVDKILRCLKLRSTMIKSNPDGTMNLEDFRETLRIHPTIPPIIFANIGTTMKGAVDDLAGIKSICDELAMTRSYIHADAALSGMILPFIDSPPPWNFASGIDSLSISGHKMIGSPMPCGVVLALKSHVDRIAQSVEYIGTLDTTLSGSRSGIVPLFLWYALRRQGFSGFRKTIQECLDVAAYATSRLNEINMHAWRHPYSNTVVFDRPPTKVIKKWQLAPYQDIAHIIAMPQVTRNSIDVFINDLKTNSPNESNFSTTISSNRSSTSVENSHEIKRSITMVAKTETDHLTRIARTMAFHGINIESFAADSLGDVDIIRMSLSYSSTHPISDNQDLPLRILKGLSIEEGLNSSRVLESDLGHSGNLDMVEPVAHDAVVVKIDNKPGALAAITQRLSQAGVLTRSLRLSRLGMVGSQGVAIIAVDDPEKARQALFPISLSADFPPFEQ